MIAESATAPAPLISIISRVEKDAGYDTNVLARSSFLGVGGVAIVHKEEAPKPNVQVRGPNLTVGATKVVPCPPPASPHPRNPHNRPHPSPAANG